MKKTLVMVDGYIMTKDKPKTNTNSIAKWTYASIIYMSIIQSAHPQKSKEILKYLQTVRLGTNIIKDLYWRDFDIQFRLKVVNDLNN